MPSNINGHRHPGLPPGYDSILLDRVFEQTASLGRIETQLANGAELHRYIVQRLDWQDDERMRQGAIQAEQGATLKAIDARTTVLEARPLHLPVLQRNTADGLAKILKEGWPYVALALAVAARLSGTDLGVSLPHVGVP